MNLFSGQQNNEYKISTPKMRFVDYKTSTEGGKK